MKKKPKKAGTSKQAAEARRRIYVEAYIANFGNATEAAKSAGYSAKTARQQGARLLSEVAVSKQIAGRQEALAKKLEISTERILLERARLAFFDPRKLLDKDGAPIPIHEIDDDTAAALAGLDVAEEWAGSGEDRVFVGYTKKYRLADKNASLTSLEKIRGMYKEDNEQSRAVTRVVIVPPKRAADD